MGAISIIFMLVGVIRNCWFYDSLNSNFTIDTFLLIENSFPCTANSFQKPLVGGGARG